MNEYEQYDALGLADLVRRREVSAVELLNAAVKRAEERNPALNAITHKWYDEALDEVKAGLPIGPFTGVPFLLKDLNLYVKGRVTTNGCAAFKDYVDERTSWLVERYYRAGLVLFGKTNTPEFGLTAATEPALFGATRNPWNLDHTPGGSSGGSSAAVAAGIVPMANASDGGGSIRIPAACTGLFGMKPTRARTPSGPQNAEGWGGLSIAHAVSWTVRDSAALLDATAGPGPGDPYAAPAQTESYLGATMRAPRRLRIAYSTAAPSGAFVDPECKQAVEKTVKLLADMGHTVEEAAPQLDTDAISQAQFMIMGASVKLAVETRLATLGRQMQPDDVEMVTQKMIEVGHGVTADQYIASLKTVHGVGRAFGDFHDQYDMWVTPTVAKPPLKIGDLDMNQESLETYVANVTGFVAFTNLMNMSGAPSMSLPLHMSADGLPVGVMISGPVGDEAEMYALAAEIERAAPWIHTRPKGFSDLI